MRFLILISALLLLSACGAPGNLAVFRQGPGEGAPPAVRQGWNDGCESGISVYGDDFYKTLYTFRQDSAMMNNKAYGTNWQDAYTYCRHWINGYLGQGLLGADYSDSLQDPRIAKQGTGVMPEFLGW